MVPDGLKESPFYMGTREIVSLFDQLVSKDGSSPYTPKSNKVFSIQPKEPGVILSLPFTVTDTTETIYAAARDLSLLSGLSI